jgi:DNA-directed RNA polymerase specialized sigma24 family protein
MDDDGLIAAVAGGDERALRELFSGNAPWLAGRLRRLLPSDAVEDVLQETFVAVWRGAGGYRPAGRPGAWLWGIAVRQAALWLRRTGRTPDTPATPVPDPATSPRTGRTWPRPSTRSAARTETSGASSTSRTAPSPRSRNGSAFRKAR